jgi:hypothetical protein
VYSGSLSAAGFVYHVAVTNQGSGYTSNPTVTISGGGCIGITAVADIDRAVIDYGAGSSITWPVGNGPNYGAGLVGNGIQTNGTYMVVDHMEVRNILQTARAGTGCASASDGVLTSFILVNGVNSTASNDYVHGRFTSCTTSGGAVQEGADHGISIGLDGEAIGNTLENGDDVGSYAACNGATPCEFSEFSIGTPNDAEVQGNYSYSASWFIRGGGAYTDLPLLIHNNESWLGLYQSDGEHINAYYIEMATGTMYMYDNILHNTVSGSTNDQQMGNGTTQYFFNNVAWAQGDGCSTFCIDSVTGAGASGGHFYWYQNTFYGNDSGTRNCLDGNSGTYTSDLYVVLQGNHCVTAANPWWNASEMAPANFSNYAGSTVQATINASSTVQSASTAASEGYAVSNLFAPTASTNDTVTFAGNANSANLTSLCSGNLAALCKDINGKPRPATGGWQAGAYVYSLIPLLPSVSSRTLQ